MICKSLRGFRLVTALNLKLKLKLIVSVYDLYRLFVTRAKLVKDSTTLNLRMRLNAIQFNTVKYFAKE